MDILSGGHPRTSGMPGSVGGGEVRCPLCSRLLVLRSGPAITAHFAHRPRQSCRTSPNGGRRTRLRLEQLTLFELDPLPAETIPVFYWAPRAGEPALAPVRPPAPPRRRRPGPPPRGGHWVKGRVGGGRAPACSRGSGCQPFPLIPRGRRARGCGGRGGRP